MLYTKHIEFDEEKNIENNFNQKKKNGFKRQVRMTVGTAGG